MRALHVIPAVAPRYGGPSTAIVPLCRALADRGVDTQIVATDADGPGHLQVPTDGLTSWQGVPAVFFRKDFSEAFKYSHSLGRWLRRHVGDFQVVHIHAVFSYASLAAAAACRRAGVPYVVRPLGTISTWSLAQKPWRKRLLLAVGAARMLRHAAAIHYTSNREMREAEETLRLSRGIVVPLGVDQAALDDPLVTTRERERDPYVLVLCRLHPKKNLEALIEAFASAVREGHAGWRLVIAGSGDDEYKTKLERLVNHWQVDQCVSFPGWVDGQTKRELIRQASVCALTSYHENFGISLVECFAAGVPAVVSRQVELSDAVAASEAGWVVETDVPSIKSGLLAALGNAGERESRSRAARRLAETFAWPAIAAQLSDIYQRMQPQHGGLTTELAAAMPIKD